MDRSIYKIHPTVQSGHISLFLRVVDGRLIKGNMKDFRKMALTTSLTDSELKSYVVVTVIPITYYEC